MILLVAFAGCNRQPKVKMSVQPPPPLELTLHAHSEVCPLDLGGQPPPAYRAELEAQANSLRQKGPAFFWEGDELKPAPEVDLELEIRNTTADDMTFFVGGLGDDLRLMVVGPEVIDVIGPGAMPLQPEPVAAKAVTLRPGESYVQPLPRLETSNRFHTHRVYWTQPGHYLIRANWHLPRTDGNPDGLTLMSQPIRVQVLPAPAAPTGAVLD
jgi:hypothetical protein